MPTLICSKTNNYAVKLNRIFFQKVTFLLLFSKAIRDIGNIIAASVIMNICSMTNNYAVKLNRIFYP